MLGLLRNARYPLWQPGGIHFSLETTLTSSGSVSQGMTPQTLVILEDTYGDHADPMGAMDNKCHSTSLTASLSRRLRFGMRISSNWSVHQISDSHYPLHDWRIWHQQTSTLWTYINWFVARIRYVSPPQLESLEGITRDTPFSIDQVLPIHSLLDTIVYMQKDLLSTQVWMSFQLLENGYVTTHYSIQDLWQETQENQDSKECF